VRLSYFEDSAALEALCHPKARSIRVYLLSAA
jgi:hypothetical protein